MSRHLTLDKGGVFSYLGELRIPVNRVPLEDYTGWEISGYIEGKDGINLPAECLVLDWLEITTGNFRMRIPVDQHSEFQQGITYTLHVILTTPSGDPLPPIKFTLAAVEN